MSGSPEPDIFCLLPPFSLRIHEWMGADGPHRKDRKALLRMAGSTYFRVMEDLANDKTLDLLNNGMIAHIGVIDDGEPYVSPVSYVIVDRELCFRTGLGRRVDAIRKNPVISFETLRTTDSGGWECVIARGEAYEVSDDTRIQSIVSALLQKYIGQIGSPLSSGARAPIREEVVIIAAPLSEISGRTSGTWFSIPMRPGRL